MLLTFHIQLARIAKPPVWRRVTVPANFSFEQFHLVIQRAFGWMNCHLYQFSEKGYDSDVFIGKPSDDDWHEVKNSSKIKLSKVFTSKGQTYTYIYDFGDDWKHKITLEKMEDIQAAQADCIAGKGACPPEDCGGAWGYEEFKETIKDPTHPEYEDMREWMGMTEGEQWDAEAFDIEKAKLSVSKV